MLVGLSTAHADLLLTLCEFLASKIPAPIHGDFFVFVPLRCFAQVIAAERIAVIMLQAAV